MITDLELIAAHFQTNKFVIMEENGYCLRTKQYETPKCYIKANDYFEAIEIISLWQSTKERQKIVFESELEELRRGAWYK